jgi:hypothetical protein
MDMHGATTVSLDCCDDGKEFSPGRRCVVWSVDAVADENEFGVVLTFFCWEGNDGAEAHVTRSDKGPVCGDFDDSSVWM